MILVMDNDIESLRAQINFIRTNLWRVKESISFLNKKVQNLVPLNCNNPKEDVGVIIGIRDRFDFRIENTFKSLRNQDYDKNLIKIILVDYGSRAKYILKLKKLCQRYNVEYVRVRRLEHWNRSHCLNIGIKRAQTKYILLSDMDIVFEYNYISEAVKELQKNPYQIIFSEFFEILEGGVTERTDVIRDYNKLLSRCKTRNERTQMYDYTFGLGMIMTLNGFFHQVRGFDENYKVWGWEDEDMVERLRMIGLELKKLETSSFVHQWHPRYEGVREEDKHYMQENLNYFRKSFTIQRNLFGWGEI